MKPIDHTKIYKQYKGKWVVLDQTRSKVLVADQKLNKAVEKFHRKFGTKKIPSVLKVPTELLPFVGIRV